MRKRSGAVSIGLAMVKALKSINQSSVLNFATISGKWPDIVGPQLGAVSRPASLRRKVMTVWVLEPVWVDTMLYMKREIIAKVNDLFSQPVVINLKIHHNSAFNIMPDREEPTVNEEEIPVSDSTREEIDSAIGCIDDSQLRSAFKQVMLKDIKLKSKRR